MKAIENSASMRLELSSKAENVPLVRQSLGGLAEAVGLPPVELNDLLTAVTEACNNVSLHAYGGREGPLAVELLVHETGIVATVRDKGMGLTIDADTSLAPRGDIDHGLGGLGLPVIRALTTEASWTEPAGGGTEVRMRFPTHPLAWEGNCEALPFAAPSAIVASAWSDAIAVTLAPLAIARKVLPRLMQALAARLHFSVDRHGDVQLVGSALLGEHTDWTSSAGVQARLIAAGDALLVTVGPLTTAAASRLMAALRAVDPGLDPAVASLAGHRHELRLSVAKSPRGAGAGA